MDFILIRLKLQLPNHLIWLTFFYLLFHSFFNTMGEILRFADRNFYNDWWNADDLIEFWKSWNLPVHRWAVRHLYKPLLNRGFSSFKASFVVFLVSAALHEYLVSVPLRMFKYYAFVGMLLQVSRDSIPHISLYALQTTTVRPTKEN